MTKFHEYVPTSGGDWMNLIVGENKIRIISEFDTFGRHYNQKTKKSVTCIGKDRGCTYCIKASGILESLKISKENGEDDVTKELMNQYQKSKSKVQFLVWIIDRRDKRIKLWSYGSSIQDKISVLAKSKDYGFSDIPNYDMTIIKKGQGLDTEYDVIADRNDSPLTAEEISGIQNNIKPVSEIIDAMKKKTMNNIYNEDIDNVNDEDKTGDAMSIDYS